MNKIVPAVACAAALFAACSSSTKSSSSGATPTSAAATAASPFCMHAEALGSLSKGASDAMAMAHAESMKDFETLASKVTALKQGAPTGASDAITTVAARLTLEAKAQEMMAGSASGGQEEEKMLADHKANDDAAARQLITTIKSTCNIDIT